MTTQDLTMFDDLIDKAKPEDVKDALREMLMFAQSTSTVDDPFVKHRLRELRVRLNDVLQGRK